MKAFAAGAIVPHNKEDLVFLRYTIGARSYLLTQTEGTESGRLFLFVKDQAGGKKVTSTQILRQELEFGGISWFEYKDGACLVVHWQTYARAQKLPCPAGNSKSDEWFNQIKHIIKEQEKAAMHRAWRLSAKDEEVKSLLVRLPDGHPDKQDFLKRLSELSSELAAVPAGDPRREGIISQRAWLIEQIETRIRGVERKPLPEDALKIRPNENE